MTNPFMIVQKPRPPASAAAIARDGTYAEDWYEALAEDEYRIAVTRTALEILHRKLNFLGSIRPDPEAGRAATEARSFSDALTSLADKIEQDAGFCKVK